MMRIWFAVLATWLGFAGLALWIDRGPALVEHDDGDRFVGRRALSILEQLVGDDLPHPAGSEHSRVVTDRIIALAEGWGYQVTIHDTAHHPWRNPALSKVPLRNLMFRAAGRDVDASRQALLLLAHHDSSPKGPGASDDGVGVAILLEIARKFVDIQPRHDVIFLITDGEEIGLLGADRWIQEHPWFADVKLVVNLEARGTGGPSLMFQTSVPDRGLIQRFASVVSRPRTSSMFAEVYRILPNDTDLSEFLRNGVAGFNFAFIGSVRNYHTPDDTVSNLDPTSLQHQGSNAWELARNLAESDWEPIRTADGNAVYFDVFGCKVIWWPAVASAPVAALMLLSWLAPTLLPRQFGIPLDSSLPFVEAALGLAWHVAVWASGAGLLWLLLTLIRWQAPFDHPWPDASLQIVASCWLASVTIVLASAELIGRWCPPNQWLLASGWWWSASALVVSWVMVGASYLWLVPCVALTIALLMLPSGWGVKPVVLAVVLAVAAGLMWMPVEGLFYDALGFRIPALNAMRWMFVCLALLPLAAAITSPARRAAMVVLAACWLATTVSIFLG